jgi:hypothetical protein
MLALYELLFGRIQFTAMLGRIVGVLTAGTARGTSFAPSRRIQPGWISQKKRRVTSVAVCADAAVDSNRIALHIPPHRRIVVSEVVVVL